MSMLAHESGAAIVLQLQGDQYVAALSCTTSAGMSLNGRH